METTRNVFLTLLKREKEFYSGALNETGFLVHIRNNNGKLEITLSEDGFEFSRT